MYKDKYDWSEAYAYIMDNRNAEPGGMEEPDLFDMPLPPGFAEDYAEELEGHEWEFSVDHGGQDDPPTARWRIGKTPYYVNPELGEILYEHEDGTLEVIE